MQFGLVLFDILTILAALLSLCVPTRIYFFFKYWIEAVSKESNVDKKVSYNFELRGGMWINFGFAILDLLTLPWGILSLATPTRFVAFFRFEIFFFFNKKKLAKTGDFLKKKKKKKSGD
ncbi:hypothetical protein RFI_34391 [Reticulomyxa filosa]|uniref:Uncharacterized protein n=1 Tax=Reticulomyxa filosa TaxID=46433 RepID=X6LN42_RETFI|nr:hypothetical protein RFI_34391 [Reticulomyxa filosa]|eukprot:ETO03019.1 hypothetical protein RFI_34391 [Reticulomyxa filosa]